jgi:hypothetical protein
VASVLPNLSVPIEKGVQNFTRDQVQTLVRSPQFAQLWDQVNRVAHQQVVGLLEGRSTGVVTTRDDAIVLNLAPVIAAVRDRLVAQGFGLASSIPTVDTSFVLVQTQGLTKAQAMFALLNTLGTWLPFLALALLVAGVLVARDRRRVLVRTGLALAVAMIALGIGLALTRLWYLDTRPGTVLPDQSAAYVFDTLVRFLRTSLRTVAVVGLVVAGAALLAGPSRPAVRTRAVVAAGIGSARRDTEAAGLGLGRFGVWVATYRRALRLTVALGWGLVLVLWDRPTGWVVAWTAVAAGLLLLVVEFLARPVSEVSGPTSAKASGPSSASTSAARAPESRVTPGLPVVDDRGAQHEVLRRPVLPAQRDPEESDGKAGAQQRPDE